MNKKQLLTTLLEEVERLEMVVPDYADWIESDLFNPKTATGVAMINEAYNTAMRPKRYFNQALSEVSNLIKKRLGELKWEIDQTGLQIMDWLTIY